MAEVIPGKTKNAPRKRDKSSWKMRLAKHAFSKCKKTAKTKAFPGKSTDSTKAKKKAAHAGKTLFDRGK